MPYHSLPCCCKLMVPGFFVCVGSRVGLVREIGGRGGCGWGFDKAGEGGGRGLAGPRFPDRGLCPPFSRTKPPKLWQTAEDPPSQSEPYGLGVIENSAVVVTTNFSFFKKTVFLRFAIIPKQNPRFHLYAFFSGMLTHPGLWL